MHNFDRELTRSLLYKTLHFHRCQGRRLLRNFKENRKTWNSVTAGTREAKKNSFGIQILIFQLLQNS